MIRLRRQGETVPVFVQMAASVTLRLWIVVIALGLRLKTVSVTPILEDTQTHISILS